MTTLTTPTLQATPGTLEPRILETIRQLQLGRDEALAELPASALHLDGLLGKAADEIAAQSSLLEEDLRRIQQRLGEFNYLLAEHRIADDPVAFRDVRERIDAAIRKAQADLLRMRADAPNWSDEGGSLEDAWFRFHQGLEIVEVHLKRASDLASEQFDADRMQLAEQLGEFAASGEDWPGLKSRISGWEERYEQFKDVLKALLMHPDAASPDPPQS